MPNNIIELQDRITDLILLKSEIEAQAQDENFKDMTQELDNEIEKLQIEIETIQFQNETNNDELNQNTQTNTSQINQNTNTNNNETNTQTKQNTSQIDITINHPSCKYLLRKSEAFIDEGFGKIEVHDCHPTLIFDYYLHSKCYSATLIGDKIIIDKCDYRSYEYVYLYAIIVFQLILNKSHQQPLKLIHDFEEFTKAFDFKFKDNNKPYIMNSSLFILRYLGDCEVNSVFGNYIYKYLNKDIFEDLETFDMNVICRFKIQTMIMFMKYILALQLMRPGKKLDINGNSFLNFRDKVPSIDFDCIDLGTCSHMVTLKHLKGSEKYIVYDYNLCGKDIECNSLFMNEQYSSNKFKTVLNEKDFQYSYIDDNHFIATISKYKRVIEYIDGILYFENEPYLDKVMNFNVFKYYVICIIITEQFCIKKGNDLNKELKDAKYAFPVDYGTLKLVFDFIDALNINMTRNEMKEFTNEYATIIDE